ncbi:MAG TPA: 4-alpha-glucanotransferase [Spirochaetales bacterium]|nr:4-alpha-glucanotransferase [Spirochaetales bacterium]HPM73315.1 4-alpha-glucanotransferase [Spirochaetales bacterium]
MRLRRSSGVLLHPTSLPGPFGIGDLGPEAGRFVDWLAEAGQSVWQVLPLGPTGYGDSPYAPFSSFAGNILLLSPETLRRDELLRDEELEAARDTRGGPVDYGRVIPAKERLARLAAERLLSSGRFASELDAFRLANAGWLDDYCLFTVIKRERDVAAAAAGVDDSSWNAYWPRTLARREPEAIAAFRAGHGRELSLIEAEQFLFRRQWDELRERAAGRGLSIVGDLPIFVAPDSADAWAHPELFRLDASGRPIEVAGVPPDYFSRDGQLWGNPLYDWERHEATGFSWWIARVEAALSLYDMVRVDHFRGLAACWAVPAGRKTARRGEWKAAPGAALLSALRARLGDELPILAEDLGLITPDVVALRDSFGLPGMRILQFGFDARESGRGLDPDNPFLPHTYVPGCVAYTGTHDNDTLAGWLASASQAERAFVSGYLGYDPPDPVRALVREAMKSAAGLAVFPMQDLLGLGSEARMNRPGATGGNWAWRLESLPGPDLADELRAMTRLYSRLPAPTAPCA